MNHLFDSQRSFLPCLQPSGWDLSSSSGQPGPCQTPVFRWMGGGLPSGDSSLSLQQNISSALWFLMQWHTNLSGSWHVTDCPCVTEGQLKADSELFYANFALLLMLLVQKPIFYLSLSIFKACFVSENPCPPNCGMKNTADDYPAVTTHHIRWSYLSAVDS